MHFTAGQSKATNAPSHDEGSRSFTRAVSSKDPLSHSLPGQGLLSNQEGLLQRKCACGGTPGVDGLCAECRSKQLGFQGLLDQPEVSRYSPEVDAGQPAPTQSPLPRAALVGPRFGHHFANVRIFSETSANVRPKLTVNEPGDANEQEADRIADGLMSTPAGSTAVPLSSSADRGPQVRSELAEQIERLQSGGSTLSTQERAHFEPRLGHDFSRVRIHTDSPAAESARMLGAYAYTTGQDISFAAGHYSPGTPSGRRLLAHEFVHVVQQSRSSPARHEREAKHPADVLMHGAPVDVHEHVPVTLIQRFSSQEHRSLGDTATGGALVNVGGETPASRFELSHGDVIALSGDYFPAAELMRLGAIPGDRGGKVGTRDEIIWALKLIDAADARFYGRDLGWLCLLRQGESSGRHPLPKPRRSEHVALLRAQRARRGGPANPRISYRAECIWLLPGTARECARARLRGGWDGSRRHFACDGHGGRGSALPHRFLLRRSPTHSGGADPL